MATRQKIKIKSQLTETKRQKTAKKYLFVFYLFKQMTY